MHLQSPLQSVVRQKKRKRRLKKKKSLLGEFAKEAGFPLLPKTGVLGGGAILDAECLTFTTLSLAMAFGQQRWQQQQASTAQL